MINLVRYRFSFNCELITAVDFASRGACTVVLINNSTIAQIHKETRKMPVKTRSHQRAAVALPKIKKLRNFGPTSAWDARALIALNVVSNETYQNIDPLSLLPKEWIERTPQDEHWEYARNIFSLSRRIPAAHKYMGAQGSELATIFYDDMKELLRVKEKELHWNDMDSQTLEEQELQSSAFSGEMSTSTQDDVDETRDSPPEEEDEEEDPIDEQILASDGDEKEKENEMKVDSDGDDGSSVRFASKAAEESIQAGLKPILENSWDGDVSFESDR